MFLLNLILLIFVGSVKSLLYDQDTSWFMTGYTCDWTKEITGKFKTDLSKYYELKLNEKEHLLYIELDIKKDDNDLLVSKEEYCKDFLHDLQHILELKNQ